MVSHHAGLGSEFSEPKIHAVSWTSLSQYRIVDKEFSEPKTNSMEEGHQVEKNQFYAAMAPRWQEITTLLAADRPPEWRGYRFEARVECEHPAFPDNFKISATFGDRKSNRLRGGVSHTIAGKIARLRMAYLDFPLVPTWKTVVIEQIWHSKTKGWSFETSWTY